MSELDVALHLRTAKVEIAVLQPGVFTDRRAVLLVELEGRVQRDVQHTDVLGHEFDFAGREIGVVGVLRPVHDSSPHRDYVFIAQRLGLGMGHRLGLDVEDDLGYTGPVSQVQEQQAPQVPLPVHPAHESRLGADVALADLSAVVGTFPAAQRLWFRSCALTVWHHFSSRYWRDRAT